MKTFLEHLKEDVLPSAQVADGSMDLRNATVVAAVNAALAGVTGQPAVTPYVVYNRISKLLAQYHIIMPKKFLEGDKGVEVFELRQYGHKMGMTDSGEFVSESPSSFYLFLQYGIITPFGVTYAKPVVGGMFRVMARIVDKPELDRLLDMAEITMKEEAECRQMAAKAMAPKEPMHDVTSDEKKKGNKEAVADSEKGQIDEVSKGAAIRAYGAAKDASDSDSRAEKTAGRLKKHIARKFGDKTVKHAERHAYASHFGRPNKDYGTDRLERAKPSSEMRKTKSGKVHKQDVESKKSEIKFRKTMSKFDKKGHLPEETVDEGYASIGHSFDWAGDVNRKAHFYGKKPKATTTKNDEKDDTYKNSKQGDSKVKFAKTVKEGRMPASIIRHKQKLANMTPEEKAKKFAGKSEEQLKSMARRHGYGKDSTEYSKHKKLDEKLTKSMSAGDVISDFVHSDDPKFKGKSKKERQKMALGAYYGMHPEKSKVNEAMGSVKKASAFRAMKRKVSTQVKSGLGVEGSSKTITVTGKNDPERKVRRIPKDSFDPSKHVKV